MDGAMIGLLYDAHINRGKPLSAKHLEEIKAKNADDLRQTLHVRQQVLAGTLRLAQLAEVSRL